jgi:Asp/Glu/hydantoin racemase
MPTLGLVHTVHRVIPGLAGLGRELFPNLRQLHYLDESLLQDAISEGGLTPDIVRRACGLIALAAERSDLVLVTCSSIGPCVEVARQMVRVPVLRVDRPMAEAAVRQGARLGVIATLASTLRPTVDLLQQCALEADRHVSVRQVLVEGAFAAAAGGDQAAHDRLVLDDLRALAAGPGSVEVVVLAQASMARVAEQLPPDDAVPILSSPRGGMQRAGEMLLAMQAGVY